MNKPIQTEDILEACTSLRAYVSFDLVNSTRFKQNTARKEGQRQWQLTFLEFIRQTKKYSKEHWHDFQSREKKYIKSTKGRVIQKPLLIGEPELWQFRGDELIFSKNLSINKNEEHGHILAYVLMLWAYRVCDSLRKQWLGDKIGHEILDVKVTIWLAGFPVNNFEVFLVDSDNYDIEHRDTLVEMLYSIGSKRHLDGNIPVKELNFLGPSIDLGFRLCELSSPKKCIISADYAFLLLHFIKKYGNSYDNYNEIMSVNSTEIPKICYEGDKELKGISISDYPAIWLDFNPYTSQQIKENGNKTNRKKQKLDLLKKFSAKSAAIDQLENSLNNICFAKDLRDCCGNLYEYLEDILNDQDEIRTKPYFDPELRPLDSKIDHDEKRITLTRSLEQLAIKLQNNNDSEPQKPEEDIDLKDQAREFLNEKQERN